MFIFEKPEDCQRIIQRKPWTVHRHLLVLIEWDPRLAEEELDFFMECFWIQINGLPPNQICPENAEKIASFLFINLEEMDDTIYTRE